MFVEWLVGETLDSQTVAADKCRVKDLFVCLVGEGEAGVEV